MTEIKNPIRKYLDTKGISPTAFAEKAGIPPSTLSKFLHCIPNMKIETVIKISNAADGLITYNDIWKAYLAYKKAGILWNYK